MGDGFIVEFVACARVVRSVAASPNVPASIDAHYSPRALASLWRSCFIEQVNRCIATILAHLSLNIMTAMGGVRLSSFVFWTTLATIFSVIAILRIDRNEPFGSRDSGRRSWRNDACRLRSGLPTRTGKVQS